MNATTGKIKWERSAIGHIGDFSIVSGDSINIAIVIDFNDTETTRVTEYLYIFLIK